MAETPSAPLPRPASSPALDGVLNHVRYYPPGYNPVEGRIAAAILEDPEAVSRESVTALASRLNVSAGSIVRFAKLIGFDGYRDLKLALVAELATRARTDTEPAVARREGFPGFIDEQLRALAFAADAVDPVQFDIAASTLLGSSFIELAAMGSSAALAHSAHFTLTAIGVRCRFLADPWDQTAAAGFLGRSGSLLAISLSGRTRAVVDAAERARDGGAGVIAITCNARSPLARVAGVSLVADIRGLAEPATEWAARAALTGITTALLVETSSRLNADESRHRRGVWAGARFGMRYDDGPSAPASR